MTMKVRESLQPWRWYSDAISDSASQQSLLLQLLGPVQAMTRELGPCDSVSRQELEQEGPNRTNDAGAWGSGMSCITRCINLMQMRWRDDSNHNMQRGHKRIYE
jgi:hypothetical protein